MAPLARQYRKVLITGPNSGIGLAFTGMLLEAGLPVLGLSRHPELPFAHENYTPIQCDLSDHNQLAAALDQVFEDHPEIDLVINNAGFGVLGELAEMSETLIEAQYAVMLVAPTLIAKRALQVFDSADRAGCLVNVSSLATELPIPMMPVYNACKAGLSGLSDSLALDLSGRASKSVVIDFRPGDFNTNFAARMEGRSDWNGVDLRTVMDRHHAEAPPAEAAVDALRNALLRRRSGRVRVGAFFQARLAPLGPRLLPAGWLRALTRCYYRR